MTAHLIIGHDTLAPPTGVLSPPTLRRGGDLTIMSSMYTI